MSDITKQTAGCLPVFETPGQQAAGWIGRFSAWLLRSPTMSERIWSRVGFLFLVLALIKAVVLVSFSKYLYEIHWRVVGQPFNWVNEVAFYAFAALVSLNLWKFSARSVARTHVARTANAVICVLGAMFILLTFHEGDKNYLYPLIHGTLALKDLRWYLSLDFFFRTPFLAAWLFAYGLIYYGLVRTKRERFILRVTALLAGAYTALCLRTLMAYHDTLLVVDAVGVASFIAQDMKKPLQTSGLLMIGVWLISMLALFYHLEPTIAAPVTDFNVVALVTLTLIAGASVLAWRYGFLNAWSWLLPFVFVVFLTFGNTNYPLADNYRNLFCLGLTLPRYLLGEFTLALGILLMGLCYRRWRPNGSLWWLDGIVLVLIVLALIDLRFSQIMGARLDWRALSLAYGETPRMMWRMARPYLAVVVLGVATVTALYAVGLWAVRKRPAATVVPAMIGTGSNRLFLVASFVLLGWAGHWVAVGDKADGESALLLMESSPLCQRADTHVWNPRTFAEKADRLKIRESPAPVFPPASEGKSELNVVLIFQESSYNKYLSLFDSQDETQPLLSKYKDRMELFPDFFSSFAGSMNARFATFTGLYPVRDYTAFTEHHVPVKSVFEILHDHGYKNSLFYSSFFDYTDFRDFLRGRDIDEMYDADTMPGKRTTKPVSWGLREQETLGAIRSKIKEYAAQKEKFFLTYVPAAPHNPFDGTPERFRRFGKGQLGDFTPAYKNELLYMDWVISSIVDQLKESGLLDRTLVIITDDHGEMLGANGGPIGHGWALTPVLANIPLIIMNPERHGYHVNDTVGSQVDLLPTMLSILGIPLPQDQLYQGASLYSATATANNRTIYLNTFQQYGILEGKRLVIGDRNSKGSEGGEGEGCYEITNRGARTIFVPTNCPSQVPSIADFDAFQENLLQNYTAYCGYSAADEIAQNSR